MLRKIIISFLVLVTFLAPATTAFALDEEDRKSKEYDSNRYELMTYSDNAWYDFMGKSGTEMMDFIKNALWSFNKALSYMVLMIVYQLFSLDIVEMTKTSVQDIASSTAGSLVYNFGLFALSVASIGIVVRAYIQQNWQAFMKLLTLVLLSMALLFSIQSEKFNYINLAHGLSITLENVVMQANPSLSQDGAFEFESFDENTARDVSIAVENKVFEALVYQPYLLLQYGTSDEAAIKSEDSDRIDNYLSANPATEEGAQKRKDIEEKEFTKYGNETIFAGNSYKQMGYIMIMMISTVIQGVVFFFIALIRIMLQFAFIIMMLLVPFILFMSLFPSFESLVAKFTKGTFMIIVFKGITMFFVLVATSFITLGYDMTNFNDDVYYRMFIQIIFSVAILFLYMKRQFVFDMLQGAAPSLQHVGAGEGMARNGFSKGKGMIDKHRKNKAYKGMNKQSKGKSDLKRKGLSAVGSAGKTGMSAAKNSARNAKAKISDKSDQARDHIRAVQNGEIPNYENPYQNDAVIPDQNETLAQKEVAASTGSVVGFNQNQNKSNTPNSSSNKGARDPRNHASHFKKGDQKTGEGKKGFKARSKAAVGAAGVTAKKISSSARSKANQATSHVKAVQRGEVPHQKENPYQNDAVLPDKAPSQEQAMRTPNNDQPSHQQGNQSKGSPTSYKRPGRNPYQSAYSKPKINKQQQAKQTGKPSSSQIRPSKEDRNTRTIGGEEGGMLNRTSRINRGSER